jgi:hypothetical protein
MHRYQFQDHRTGVDIGTERDPLFVLFSVQGLCGVDADCIPPVLSSGRDERVGCMIEFYTSALSTKVIAQWIIRSRTHGQ